MEGSSDEQKVCKGMLKRTEEETLQLTPWMKTIVGKRYHCVVESLYLLSPFFTVRQTGGQESANVHHALVEKMEQIETTNSALSMQLR